VSQLVIRKELQYKGKKFRSLLERSTAKEFILHRLSVDRSQLGLWNVCAFAANEPSGSKNGTRSMVETVTGTSILIDFKNEKEQSNFELCFKFAKGERVQLGKQFNRSMQVAKSQEHTPTRSLPVIVGRSPTSSSRSQSVSHSGSSETPRLDPIPPSSPLFGEDPDDKDLEATQTNRSSR
jgi:hypothetical protein